MFVAASGITLRVRFMAPHLTAKELDSMQTWSRQGFDSAEILRRIATGRARRGHDVPLLRQVQLAL